MDDFMKRNRRFRDGFEDFMGDDFFAEFEGEFRRMQDHMSHLFDEALRNNETDHVRRYVYGFTMHTGPDGKPVLEEFGNVPRHGEDQIPGEREPMVDVIDGRDEVTVIAELPGVDKKNIDLKSDETSLTISVRDHARRYHKVLDMPGEVDPESIKAQYKNGILEVKLKKARKKNGSKRIKNGILEVKLKKARKKNGTKRIKVE
ncbi:MAG: archaeal heat shock protein Hsp20 [Candidatus Altiarchaeota archaeon]